MAWPLIASAAAQIGGSLLSSYMGSKKKTERRLMSTQTPMQRQLSGMAMDKVKRGMETYKPYPGRTPVQGAHPGTAGLTKPTEAHKDIFAKSGQIRERVGERAGRERGGVPKFESNAEILNKGFSTMLTKILQNTRG
jgi:hypothetical protein